MQLCSLWEISSLTLQKNTLGFNDFFLIHFVRSVHLDYINYLLFLLSLFRITRSDCGTLRGGYLTGGQNTAGSMSSTTPAVLPVKLINRCARASQPAVAAVISVVQRWPAIRYRAQDHGPELPQSSITQHYETQQRHVAGSHPRTVWHCIRQNQNSSLSGDFLISVSLKELS